MEKGDIFDRILYMVDSHADGKIAKFARMIGSGDQTMRSIVKNRRNYPGYEVLVNILHAFEWLSPEWLMLGTGEMKRNAQEQVPNEPQKECEFSTERLLCIIESQQKVIENLSMGVNCTAGNAKTAHVKKGS